MTLHRLPVATSSMPEAPPIVHEVLRSAGRPLPPATLDFMESVFGRDLSHVRIHSGRRAYDSTQAVGALAYTVGADVVLGAGDAQMRTAQDRGTLAHELTHVVQQGSSPIQDGKTPQRLAVAPSGDALEVEADHVAALASRWPPHVTEPSDHLERQAGLPPIARMRRSLAVQRACPPAPTGLGRKRATECGRRPPSVVGGSILRFCQDSDELMAGQDGYLRDIVKDATGASTLDIHGNASVEGPSSDYNYNLACTRAKSMAARLQAAGVTASITLVSHGPVTAFGGAAANRNVEIVIHGPAKTTDDHHDERCTPKPGIPSTVCGAYRAQDWWLPEAYVVNATCACQTTPNEPTSNCVRKSLQDSLAATSPTIVRTAALMKPYDPLTVAGAIGAAVDPMAAVRYSAFVQSVLTPRIYRDHQDAYRKCCCTSGPAPYGAWIGVTTVPLTCAMTGASIALFGSCHGTPGRW